MFLSFLKKNAKTFWMYSTFILALIFIGYVIYTVQPNILDSGFIGSENKGSQEKTIFHLPITIVTNSADASQKEMVQKFKASLLNPQRGLASSDLQEAWLDYKSQDAQAFIKESDAKYLPLVAFDKTIEQHPQFKAISSYLQAKGDHYYFHLYPALQHLKTPLVTGGHNRGADQQKAKVTILEYGSFSCDYCQKMEAVLNRVLQNFPGKVTLVFKHFDRGGTDTLLAQSTECADLQNKNFWTMHDLLYRDQKNLFDQITKAAKAPTDETVPLDTVIRDYLDAKARYLGLDMTKFKACMTSGITKQVVDDHTNEAADYGINGTPAFFVNGKFHDGVYTYDELKAVIEAELQKTN